MSAVGLSSVGRTPSPRDDAFPGPYQTKLKPDEEAEFRKWVADNKVPFRPDQYNPQEDYDMRGFWKDMKAGKSTASSGQSEYDGQIHYSDWYKTPYHRTFSRESKWAVPDRAPQWIDNKLVDRRGYVIADETPKINTEVNRSKR